MGRIINVDYTLYLEFPFFSGVGYSSYARVVSITHMNVFGALVPFIHKECAFMISEYHRQ